MHRRTFLTCGTALVVLCATKQPALHIGRVTLSHPSGRMISCRVIVPVGAPNPLPVLPFSHGANAGAHLYDALLSPLAASGAVIIAPDHLDAGATPPPTELPPEGLFRSRVDDLWLALSARTDFDAFARSSNAALDWSRICVMGHSFGAAVAQSLAGARLVYRSEQSPKSSPHPDVSAVIAVSPPGPRPGLVPYDAWQDVRIPAVAITGTRDILPGFIDDWQTHLKGFELGANSNRWSIVGEGVDHYFGGLICRLKLGPEADLQRPALLNTIHLLEVFIQRWKDGARVLPLPPEKPSLITHRL